ncbi:uncharacterized protein LOC133926469 isoform X2 [Phragmites australis]|uniref:uncharacterized protein LOC133926469 isoform X2 n=1 Tax=Phragmites australis TaxID=29695 RepID=UPI002D7927CB|nr:uncharacterized protein LOC133926469 isoform X2 [Phragmites australis]
MWSPPPPPPPLRPVDAERNSRSVEGWVRPGEMQKSNRMARPQDSLIDGGDVAVEEGEGDIAVEEEEEAFNFDEIHEMGGLHLVGGVDFINQRTALFCDLPLRRILNSDERFQAYLQFLEEASQIAATELVSSYNSPVDLIRFTDADRKRFFSDCFDYIMMCRDRSNIADDKSNGCRVDNISKKFHLTEGDIQCHKNNKKEVLQTFVQTRRHFAYRKGLLKLDFIQSNSDPAYVLERLKSSNIWSELGHHERRLGLESHMNLLKELEKTKSSSLSEYENLGLEKINLELGSELQKHLDDSDWRLMHQYCIRKKLMNLSRECAIQAEATGYILCEEALPVPSMEQIAANTEVKRIKQTVKQPVEGYLAKRLPYMKQTLKQSLGGFLRRINEKFRSGHARVNAWRGLALAATVATLASAGISNKR